jgi:hypothetical protein
MFYEIKVKNRARALRKCYSRHHVLATSPRPRECSTWSSSSLAFAYPSMVGSKVVHAGMTAN